MKNSFLLLGAIASLVALVAEAQTNPHNGTWTASYKSDRGTNRDGTVVIDNQGGSWDMNVQSRNDPCVGQKVPITVETATPEELVFQVNRSMVLAGCIDSRISMKALDAGTLTGTFGGRDFTMKKK